MIDQATIQQIATQTNIPPPILYALTQAPVNGQLLDSAEALSQAATNLQRLFTKDGSWESAISEMVTGDPQGYQSPTSSAGGQVSYIMGIAGSRPTYGMTGWQPSDPAQFTQASRAFGQSINQTAQYGGVVTAQHAQAWYQAANGARINAYQASAGRAGPGAQAPFSFESMPFANQYMAPGYESETFGERSGPGGYAEQGNDYAMAHGTPLTAAISGRVKVVVPSNPHSNTGLTVYIVRPDGSKMYYGHLAGNPGDLPVKDGDYVQAGQPIGAVGGDPSKDPFPGNSTGSHVEIGVYDSRGVLYDPRPMLQAATTAKQPPQNVQRSAVRSTGNTPQEGMGADSRSRATDPHEVSQFATRLRSMNIEPEQFIRDFPPVSTLRRRLLGSSTTLDDYSKYAGMDAPTTMKAVRAEPHPVYPEFTVGQMHDTAMASQLAAQHYGGRDTSLFEVSRLVASGVNGLSDLARHFTVTPGGVAARQPATPDVATGSESVRRGGMEYQ